MSVDITAYRSLHCEIKPGTLPKPDEGRNFFESLLDDASMQILDMGTTKMITSRFDNTFCETVRTHDLLEYYQNICKSLDLPWDSMKDDFWNGRYFGPYSYILNTYGGGYFKTSRAMVESPYDIASDKPDLMDYFIGSNIHQAICYFSIHSSNELIVIQ